MSEPVDIYSDQFSLNLGAYGCTINFRKSSAMPPAPGESPHIENLAAVRISLEHLKVMSFILHRQVQEYERQSGISVAVPVRVLNSLRISPEDWNKFWQ